MQNCVTQAASVASANNGCPRPLIEQQCEVEHAQLGRNPRAQPPAAARSRILQGQVAFEMGVVGLDNLAQRGVRPQRGGVLRRIAPGRHHPRAVVLPPMLRPPRPRIAAVAQIRVAAPHAKAEPRPDSGPLGP